ncbi:DUF1684 domain-containing protein [Agreia sp. COWG]|uniref:DUF1684 domain-containing protein n=1 Tax=Agreia sp. COWG TaxID=2773266 RepID=UPI00192572C4|nr:DUF1684 domain-containing protein [Agreia sp. COWG]
MSTAQTQTESPVDRVAFERKWIEWHDSHEKLRAAPHGFLAVTSLNWLDETPTRYPDAPGEWSTSAGGPVVSLAEGEHLVVDGRTLTGRHAFGVLAERGGVTATSGDAELEVARRGGHDILRPRHPEHHTLVDYAGTPAYPADPRWVAHGVFLPFDEPRLVTVGSVAEGLEHVYDSPGVIEFSLGGETFRLTAFNGQAPGSLFVLFTDASSGVTTYAANRSLQVAAPDAEGRVTVDFTRAANLPCAYTEFATCPLPPAENRLPIAIEAGEKAPR